MAEKTDIAWCDSTLNPWDGCSPVSPGCDNCYAWARNKRFYKGENWGPGAPRRRTAKATWRQAIKWNEREFFECYDCGHRGEGIPFTDYDPETLGFVDGGQECEKCRSRAMHPTQRRVFCASIADWLDNEVPIEWLVDLLDLIKQTPDLNWLLLTKRISNFNKRIQQCIGYCYDNLHHDLGIWLTNWLRGYAPGQVWLGITVVNQPEADRDIPKLLKIPARIRWLSMEPLLGPIDLNRFLWQCCGNKVDGHPGDGWMTPPDPPECCGEPEPCEELHWGVVGGESGSNARPMHPDWARSLRDQFVAAGKRFLFKQWGEFGPEESLDPENNPVDSVSLRNAEIHICERGERLYRIGKKRSGRMLDGRTWDEYPEVI